MNKRLAPVIVIFATLFLISVGFAIYTANLVRSKEQGVRIASETDPQLAVAMQTARNTLDKFFTKLKDGTVKGAVKVKFQSPVGPEYIWVDHIKILPKDTYAGTLADDPKLLAGKHKGDAVTFTKADIVDWVAQYPDGTEDGNFTQDILLREGK